MALIGNVALLHKSPAKYTTGTVGFNDRANWNKPGMMRSRGDLTVSLLWKYDAIPSGYYAGRAFFPPQKAGRMTTRSVFSVDAVASGAEGLPGSGASTIAVDAAAIGGLIAGGVANATITVNATASIAGLAAGSASSTIAVNAAAAIGATAWGVASSTMTVTGSAIGYGLGYMQASTVDNSVLTATSISAAVWNAILANFNENGSAGKALASAGSGGVDLEALAQAILAAAQITPIHSNVKKMNSADVLGTGAEGDKWRGV